MDTTTGPAVFGPLPAGADMLAGLTLAELNILNAHLGGGWPKQAAVHGQLNDLWWDTDHLMNDCHQAHMARYAAIDYLKPVEPAEVPETEQAAAPPLPDGVAQADPANPYGSYTDPAGKHGRYDAASPADVAQDVEPGLCKATTPTRHGHSKVACTLANGHDGDHIASGTGDPGVSWPEGGTADWDAADKPQAKDGAR